MKGSTRLIVVDDDLNFCNFVADVAKTSGIEVDIVSSVHQFKQYFSLYNYDLITMDIAMPDKDGFEFINELVTLNCQAEIILISGQSELILNAAESLAKAKGLNVIATLRKPFDIDEFEALLLAANNAA